MTDIPELLAWHTGRPCLRLCRREIARQRIEGMVGPVQCLYFSPAIWNRPREEQGDWWTWALRPGVGFAQFAYLPSATPNSVLLLRQEAPVGPPEKPTELPR